MKGYLALVVAIGLTIAVVGVVAFKGGPGNPAVASVSEGAGQASGAAAAPAGPEFVSPFETALQQAKESGKLLVVDISIEGCGWCTKLRKETFTDPQVLKLAKNFVFTDVDANEQPKVADKYHPEGFPTVVFLTGAGKEVHRIDGYVDANEFIAEAKQALRAAPRQQPADNSEATPQSSANTETTP